MEVHATIFATTTFIHYKILIATPTKDVKHCEDSS